MRAAAALPGTSQALRAMMREAVSGVYLASTCSPGANGVLDLDAVVVNSFVSVSLDPALVCVTLRHDSRLLAGIRQSGVFAVSILAAGDAPLVAVFSRPCGQRPGLGGGRWRQSPLTGCPLLVGAPGSVDCLLHQVVALGDHALVVGQVCAVEGGMGDALAWYRGGPGRVERSGVPTTTP